MSPVSAVIAENAVVLVGVPGCGYCARAKDMLINAGQEFRFYELSRDGTQQFSPAAMAKFTC